MENKKKTLILIGCYNKYFWQYIDLHTNEYDIYTSYTTYSTVYSREYVRKHTKKIFVKKGKKESWIYHLKEYDKVIIFEGAYSNEVGRILKRKKFEKGVFVIFWNYTHRTPSKQWEMLSVIPKYIKVYSFNKTDCIKYNLFHNPTFYEPYPFGASADILYDIMFSGMIKHARVALLCDTLKKIHSEDYKVLIDVWSDKTDVTEYFEIHDKITPYMDYLKMIRQARVMLDLRDIIEDGLSLRALEAMFYHKKIITNSPYIKNEAFYSKNNIFILGEDDIHNLKDFIYSPFDTAMDFALTDYRLKPWIERFI